VNKYYYHSLLAIFFLTFHQFQVIAQHSLENKTNYIPDNKGFIENRGQIVDSDGNLASGVLFKFQSSGVDVYLTKSGIDYVYTRITSDKEDESIHTLDTFSIQNVNYTYETYRTDLTLKNANENAEIIKEFPLKNYYNYYYAYCPDGITHVKSYQRITYKNIYPNIDWVLYPYQDDKSIFIKYDFIVHPGGNPENIRMQYDGFENIGLTPDGDLVLNNALGTLLEQKPFVYQDEESEVTSRFIVEMNEVHFEIDAYDKNKILVIDPSLNWATYYGSSSFERAESMSIDYLQNILITGRLQDVPFPVLNAYQSTNAGWEDAYVAQFDSSGVLQWATYYGGTVTDIGVYIASDSSNNAIIVGMTMSTNLPMVNAFQGSLIGPGSVDGFVAKFDISGLLIWASYYGGSDNEVIHRVAIDPWDNIVLLGHTYSNDIWVTNVFQDSAAGAGDLFITKIDSNGSLVWSTYLGGSITESSGGIDTDPLGNIFVTGYTTSSNFPIANAFQSTLNSASDAFVVKFDANCNLKWSTFYGGNSSDEPRDIAVNYKGDATLVGFVWSTNLFVPNAVQPSYGGGNSDGFVAQFDSSGTLNWATYYGGNSSEVIQGITVDQYSNYFLTGVTWGTFPLVDPYQNSLNGTADIFIVKLDSLGTPKWSTFYGGSSSDVGHTAASDLHGGIIVSGGTMSTDFPIQNAYQPTNAGSRDICIIKFYEPCPGVITNPQNATICYGDSILLEGSFQNTQGVYRDTLISAKGCDSVLVTVLSVNSANTTLTISICSGDSVYLGGTYQKSAGTYYDSLLSGYGCDSIITTNLLVDLVHVIQLDLGICSGDSAFLGGSYQTTSGIYTDSLMTISGCDSVIITTLTVDLIIVNSLSFGICIGDSLLLSGMYQNSSGIYHDTLTAVLGCDSIVISTLSVNPQYDTALSLSICAGDSLFLEGSYQTSSGIYFDTLLSVNGCDSSITTMLNLLPGVNTAASMSICSGDSVLLGGVYRTISGVYIDTLTAFNGCDSLVTITLSIDPLINQFVSINICAGDSVFAGGLHQTTSGTYYDTIGTGSCDSIVITTLIVAPVYITSESMSICAGDSLLLGGAYQETPGVYTDSLITVFGCDSVVVTNLSIATIPLVSAGSNDTICAGASIKLSASNETNYIWEPAESLNNPNIANPVASPEITTTYTLFVLDNGCLGQDEVTIVVDHDCDLFIPNIFSPNGDGNNDQLYVHGKGIETIHFVLFNRWGEKVFEATDKNQGWDGTFKGKPLNMGVYVYFVEGSFTNGIKIAEHGNVTLVR